MKLYSTKAENKVKVSAKSENGKSCIKYFLNGKQVSAYNLIVNAILTKGKLTSLEGIAAS